MHDEDTNEAIRIDKWLWTARFFKTRSVAAEAVTGGKVQINGTRAKPSRTVRSGDSLNIRHGPYEWTVIVKAVAKLRGPALQAQLLYQETEGWTEDSSQRVTFTLLSPIRFAQVLQGARLVAEAVGSAA